jgi:hypothetical protein
VSPFAPVLPVTKNQTGPLRLATAAARATKPADAKVVERSGTPLGPIETTVVSVVGATGLAHAKTASVPLGFRASLPACTLAPAMAHRDGSMAMLPDAFVQPVAASKAHSSRKTGEYPAATLAAPLPRRSTSRDVPLARSACAPETKGDRVTDGVGVCVGVCVEVGVALQTPGTGVTVSAGQQEPTGQTVHTDAFAKKPAGQLKKILRTRWFVASAT